MNKSRLTIRTTLLLTIGILNILIAVLVGHGVYGALIRFHQAQSLKQDSEIIDDLYEASRDISLERGASLSVVFAASETAEYLRDDIARSRKHADISLEHAFASLKNRDISKLKARYNELRQLRVELDRALQITPAQRDPVIADQLFKASTALIREINIFILGYDPFWRNAEREIVSRMMFKHFVWELAEYAGEEYAIIGRMIAESKRPTPDQQEQLIRMRGRIQYGWEILRKYALRDDLAQELLPLIEEAETHYFFTFEQISGLFYGLQPASAAASYPISIEMWLGMAAQTVDSFLALQTGVMKKTRHHVDLMEARARFDIFISAMVFILALSLSAYCWHAVVFRVVRPVRAMVDALYKASRGEEYEMPANIHPHDEIGKLISVLEIHQGNVRKIKQSNDELERFAYIAAHDLKSPLRAVDNISQWLEEDLIDSLPQKDREYLEELRNRVRHMDRLLDDTLEYARAGARMERKSSETVTGKTLMEQIASLLELPPGFTLKIDPRLDHIRIQKMPLQQVLYNLVNNAIKHHHKTTGMIEVSVEESESSYTFSVKDDGPGIDPQYHRKIFEMFQTLQPRDKSKGRGMGLAMVRKIVVTNGGMIAVNSQPGRGAEFRFTWPKTPADTQARRQYA